MASRSTTTAPRLDGSRQRTEASRSRGPRIRLRYVALVLVCGWAIYYYGHVQHSQLAKLQGQEAALQVQLHSAQAAQSNLKRKVAEFQNDAFIARYASAQFHLIQPGQVSFVVGGH